LCEFLKSLDEKVLEEKDSVCEPFFNEKMDALIQIIFEDPEETNNTLGIELIDGILFINEFSDIYSPILKRKPFRFGYIACNHLDCYFIFHEKDAISDWLKKSINDILTLNTPSERAINALLQLHGF